MKKTMLIGLSLFAVTNGALAKVVDVAFSGPGAAPIIRASEVTNVNFTGTVPANVAGALDSDDSTFNRTLSDCSGLSAAGTAVAYDLVNITNTSGNPGNITFSTCPGAGDSFLLVYSAFNPATPLAGCLIGNDDFGGAACSTVTFPMAAAEARTVVVTAFDNAAVATGLFPYTITFAGTTGTPSAAGTLTLSNTGAVAFASTQVGQSSTATLTVSNTGTGALNVTALAAPAAPFSVSGGTCTAVPFTLQAATSCTVIYSFSPTALGAATQTLAIATNGGNGNVTLTGTGTLATVIVPVPTLNAIGFALMTLALAFIGMIGLTRRQA